jgi:6-phosphogluconolactonase (cycloisomerase 2 family)
MEVAVVLFVIAVIFVLRRMKVWQHTACVSFAVVLSLAGCGGGGGSADAPPETLSGPPETPAPTAPGAPAPAPAAPATAAIASLTYAIDADASLVRVLRVDASSGALAPFSGATAAVMGRPVALAASRQPPLLAVVSSNGDAAGVLRIFRIPAGGQPLAPSSTVQTGSSPTAVTISSDAKWVYVSHPQGIDGFQLDAAGVARKVAGSPFVTGYAEIRAAVDPAYPMGRPLPEEPVNDRPAADLLLAGPLFAATKKAPQGEVSTLGSRDDGTLYGLHTGVALCAIGLPAMGSTFSASGAGTIALAASNGFVYALNRDSSTVAGFRLGDPSCRQQGWMPPVQGSPFATGARPSAFIIGPSGRYMYVGHTGGPGRVSAYGIDPQSGTLSPLRGSPFPLAMVPARMWTDRTGQYLYTSDTAGNVDVLTIDPSTGAPGAARSTLPGSRAHMAQDVLLPTR